MSEHAQISGCAHLSWKGVCRSRTGLFSLKAVEGLLRPHTLGVLSRSGWLSA